jgi:hypothetical protein
LGAALAIIVGKPLGSRIFNEGILEKNIRPKVQEILNFEFFFFCFGSLNIQLNYNKWLLKRKINWVTSSHLGHHKH